MNRPAISLVGNVTADPKLSFTSSGLALASFSVAVNRRVREGDAWVDADPEFHNVVCWRQLAENVAESVSKGTRVVVVGELSQRSWTDENDNKRSTTEVVASSVGAALDFATAVVTRTGRTSPAPARTAPTPPQPSQKRWEDDEEPF